MRNQYKVLFLIILVLTLFVATAVVMAQDSSNGETTTTVVSSGPGFSLDIPAVSYKDRIKSFAEIFFRLIYNLAYLPVASPLVQLLVQVTKRFTASSISAPMLNFMFTVIMFVIWIVVNEIGYGGQFDSVVSALTTIGTSVLSISLSAAGSSKLYQFARGVELPILGYSRTPATTS